MNMNEKMKEENERKMKEENQFLTNLEKQILELKCEQNRHFRMIISNLKSEDCY